MHNIKNMNNDNHNNDQFDKQYIKEWYHTNFLKTLSDINCAPIEVKDATVYESPKWVEYDKRFYKFPIQRRILKNECVLDFDKVTDITAEMIVKYMKETGMKFNAWRSSKNGLHIHFFTNVVGKFHKIKLVEIISSRIDELFGVKNDINPMRQEFIRCEYSVHPQKDEIKTPLWLGINPLFPENEIPYNILKVIEQNLTPLDDKGNLIVKSPQKSLENPPKCVKYILSNAFADGRKRLLFALASWYKNLLPDEEILKILKTWAKRQGMIISDYKIRAIIRSTNGTAGCTYRHMLLEELGHDPQCKK